MLLTYDGRAPPVYHKSSPSKGRSKGYKKCCKFAFKTRNSINYATLWETKLDYLVDSVIVHHVGDMFLLRHREFWIQT